MLKVTKSGPDVAKPTEKVQGSSGKRLSRGAGLGSKSGFPGWKSEVKL